MKIEELLVWALLDDPPLLQDDDSIGLSDRRKPMGYYETRAPLQQHIECALNEAFRFGIECRGSLVEYEDGWVFE